VVPLPPLLIFLFLLKLWLRFVVGEQNVIFSSTVVLREVDKKSTSRTITAENQHMGFINMTKCVHSYLTEAGNLTLSGAMPGSLTNSTLFH
jgi:hypothetical protein